MFSKADIVDCIVKARFSHAGVTSAGLSKLDNHDFLIQDSHHRRPIELRKSWAAVFRPGQNVDMSMIFHRFACPPSTCPACLEVNEDGTEQTYCQSCGLCYQNVQAISNRESKFQLFERDIDVSGEDIPYMLRYPGKEPELKLFRPTRDSEDEMFEGYRRVQLVSQHLDLLNTRYPGLQLIEDFCRFAELLQGAPDHSSQFLTHIHFLHGRAIQHLLEQKSSFPAFASFSQVEQVRKESKLESLNLKSDIDRLVQDLYNDPDTKDLMKYIKKKYPSNHGKDYYTGVLTKMVNLSESTKISHAKVRSTERMEWRLSDARSA